VEALKELDRRSGRFEVDEGIIGQIRRAPLGVVLCLGPFNYPLNETFTTLLPALVMGNTVVFKPPKLGVLLFRPLLEAFRDAFPPGVVNTIYGEGRTTIGPLMRSGKVDVLAFIGTSRVSHQLKSQHPALNRLRCVLGLDAKNPAIVLEDADLELALQECLGGSLAFNGQRCTALKILFVHDRLYDRFVEGLAAKADALRRGMPWEEGVFATPLPEQRKPESMQAFVDDALAHGGRIANALGGKALGTFYAPTVIADVTSQMRLWREEQFGPVVPVVRFRDVEEPLAYVRDSTFGQQVSVFGNDPAALGALVDPLVNQVSRVNLNSQCQRGPDSFPFTGRKDSAEGTLSVGDALRVFSIRALVAAKATERNKAIVSQIVRERSSNFLSTDFIF
jgi:glyceraldehyde-3-phosphate dehydrogenase (NADP+)